MGANDLKLFAVSDSALRPDMFHTSFLGIQGQYVAPAEIPNTEQQILPVDQNYVVPTVVIIAIIIGITIVLKRKRK